MNKQEKFAIGPWVSVPLLLLLFATLFLLECMGVFSLEAKVVGVKPVEEMLIHAQEEPISDLYLDSRQLAENKHGGIYIEVLDKSEGKALENKLQEKGFNIKNAWGLVYKIEKYDPNREAELIHLLGNEKNVEYFSPILHSQKCSGDHHRWCYDIHTELKILLRFDSIQQKKDFFHDLPDPVKTFYQPDIVAKKFKFTRWSIAKPLFKNRMDIDKYILSWTHVASNHYGKEGVKKFELLKFKESEVRKIDDSNNQ